MNVRHEQRWVAAGTLAAVLTAATALHAGPDIELGRYLATDCLTCHRPGAGGGAIPNINGMAEDRFTVLLTAYREKRLSNPVMQNVAQRLTDEEIAALAAYFASLRKP
jgi:cytochrome c